MSTIIEVEKLKKTFRSFQLHDIAFHVSEGCITGLIGIDGSGKSTIIKCLINLIQRDSGKVEFWGENINDKNYSVMNRVGTILSGNEFYDGLTIRETKKIISGAYSNWNETVFQEYWARWKGRDCSEKQRLSTMSRQERVLLSIAMLKQIPNEEFLKVDIGNYGFTGICNDYNSIKPFCANMAVERSTVSEIMRAYLWRRANA